MIRGRCELGALPKTKFDMLVVPSPDCRSRVDRRVGLLLLGLLLPAAAAPCTPPLEAAHFRGVVDSAVGEHARDR